MAACCWATQGIAYGLILDGIQTDGLTVVTLRAITATVVLWGWLAVTDRSALKIPRADLPSFAVLGLVAITIFYPALFYAYKWTSVSVATTLLYLAPALVTLGAAAFLGEALTRGKSMALVLTFVGSALVVQVTQPANLTGDAAGIALGLVAAASYATYSLLGKHLLRRHRMATVLAAYLPAWHASAHCPEADHRTGTWPAPREALTIGLYTGVMTTLVPITLFTFGLSRLPSGDATHPAHVRTGGGLCSRRRDPRRVTRRRPMVRSCGGTRRCCAPHDLRSSACWHWHREVESFAS